MQHILNFEQSFETMYAPNHAHTEVLPCVNNQITVAQLSLIIIPYCLSTFADAISLMVLIKCCFSRANNEDKIVTTSPGCFVCSVTSTIQ